MTDKKIKFKDILQQKLTVHERKAIRYNSIADVCGTLMILFVGFFLIEAGGSLYYNQEYEPSLSLLLTVISMVLMVFWCMMEEKEKKISINEFLQSGRQEKVSDKEPNEKD